MHWKSLEEFFSMGGYAFFVWSSLGATVMAMGLEVWMVHLQRKQLKLHGSPNSQDNGNV
jgi:heme exporter protein D